MTNAPNGEVAVSLSGGGVRALLFGLGALRAVVAAQEQRGYKLATLVGVSGGGIGAAYAASRIDLGTTMVSEWDRKVLAPAVRTITSQWLVRSPYVLALGFGVLLAALVGLAVSIHGLALPPTPRAVVAFVAFLAALLILGLRGLAIERAMRAALFPDNPPLADIDSTVRLVLQTADLGSGEATYLTSHGAWSYRWGESDAKDISLVRAARATATFPVVFPVLRQSTRRFKRWKERPPKRLALVDGGVYDNMGSQWLLSDRQPPAGTYLVLVNASGNIRLQKAGFGWPVLGELLVLWREKDIQYDATTAPRRQLLYRLFDAEVERGTIVQIDGSIYEWVSKFATRDDDRARRAQAMLVSLSQQGDKDYWHGFAAENASEATSLLRLSPETAVRLVFGGYLAASVQLHILEDWPPPEFFDRRTMSEALGVTG